MFERIEQIKRTIIEKIGKKNIRLMLLILLMTFMLCVAIRIGEKENLFDGNRLRRGEIGEGDTVYELICTDGESGQEIAQTVSVSERKCTPEELDEYFEKAYQELERQVMADNNSLDEVSEDLNFSNRISGMPVSVEWIDIDKRYFYSDGGLKQENLSEAEIVMLTARLIYYEEVRVYSFFVKLVPNKEPNGKSYEEELEEAIFQADMSSLDKDWIELPGKIGTRQVRWSEKKSNSLFLLVVLGIVSMAAIPLAGQAEKSKNEKKRKREMLKDYPDIISKFILLITAGMTCKGAWSKICRDYKDKSNKKRAAYEEMVITMEELELGKSEAAMYEEFGRRCDIHAYQRFGTLLANNLKRGSSDILSLLALESKEAFETRKEEVQRRAEEAETKLLGPMVGMLGIVIALVVVPAFAAFG